MELKLRAWDGEEFLYSEDCNSLREFFDRTEEKGSFKTVYQLFTGLKDKKEKEIYEGDICERIYHLSGLPWDENSEKKNPNFISRSGNMAKYKEIVEIFFDDKLSAFDFRKKSNFDQIYNTTLNRHTLTVVGNIFENPEIMNDILPNNEPDLSTER